MKQQETLAGIDIGSTQVRTVVASWSESGEITIIGAGEAPTRGVSRASIVDLEETVTSVSESLERAEKMIGAPLSRAVVSISSPQCKVIESQGVVAVARPNSAVQQTDVDRADEQSQAFASSPNFEIIHILPKYYNLDTQEKIKDPVGMTGMKLEAHTQIILAPSAQVKLLEKCLYRTQLEIDGHIFGPLATAEAALTRRQKDLGCALINIGAWTTSVAIFEEDKLLHAAVLPIGAEHITNDVAIGCRVALDIAERIKIDLGVVSAGAVGKRDEIDIAKYANGTMPRHLYPKKDIATMMESRLDEIFKLVRAELRKAGKDGKLPAGAVLTGGGAKLKGIIEYAKDALALPVFMGSTDSIRSPIDKVKDPQFSTAVGLVYYAEPEEEAEAIPPVLASAKRIFSSIIGRFRK